MEKFGAIIMKEVVKREFTPILNQLENGPHMRNYLEERVSFFEQKYHGSLKGIQILKDQLELNKDITKLIKDIIEINWEDDNAEILYNSMVRCYKEMIKRNEEIRKLIRVED
jgi:hypothetical protein